VELKGYMNSKSKHSGWLIALGAALGAVFGILAGHVGFWLIIGIAIGLALGAAFRRKQPVCPECAAIHRLHQEKFDS
jgi:predicted lysophospholipase L1 biosynthesis ABC-type transport system permease subunit